MTGPGARAEAEGEGAQGRPTLRALAPAELARLRAAALELLETRGVVVPGEVALGSLADAGAPVEPATSVARIPARLVEEALDLAPASPVLAGRLLERDVALGQTGLLATGGPAVEVLTGDGERRFAERGDLTETCRLADGLPEVAVVAGPPLAASALAGAAGEGPAAGRRTSAAAVEDLALCLAHTTKHVMLTTVESPAQGEAVAAMATAVAGDEATLRRRPPVSLVAPGLRPAGPAIDALLAAARRGLPVGFNLAAAGARSAETPTRATPPGEALAEAGSLGERLPRLAASALAACVAVQLAAPEAAFIASLPGDALRTPAAGLAGAPAAWLLALAYNELMSSFGLPTLVAPANAAQQPGWRSSVETTFAALITAVGNPTVLSGAGLLADGRAFSSGQLVLDCESHAVCGRIAQGIEVDEETVAQETIAAIGIGGNALAQRHTRRHMRDVWRPRVFDRSSLEAWQREGRMGSERKAQELAARILTEHQVPPLEAEKAETLARIIATSGL